MQERQIWAVWTNTDLTEGRGYEFVRYYCEWESTARRLARGGYVQGTDCRVTQERMIAHDGRWYAPGTYVVQPNDEDRKLERQLQAERERTERKAQAIARARELGLSEEDLVALQG